MKLAHIVRDFAWGMHAADRRGPQAKNARTGMPFQPGLGPHTEGRTVELVLGELAARSPEIYGVGRVQREVPYPSSPRSRCDLCLGEDSTWEWAIEFKMLRLMGDNGKPNDNILMHILSPYTAHHSAVTDGPKLLASGLGGRKALIIFGYEYDHWPMLPVVRAFEILAARHVTLYPREEAECDTLIHPVHSRGLVFGWELKPHI